MSYYTIMLMLSKNVTDLVKPTLCKNIKCCGASCDRKIPDEELVPPVEENPPNP